MEHGAQGQDLKPKEEKVEEKVAIIRGPRY